MKNLRPLALVTQMSRSVPRQNSNCITTPQHMRIAGFASRSILMRCGHGLSAVKVLGYRSRLWTRHGRHGTNSRHRRHRVRRLGGGEKAVARGNPRAGAGPARQPAVSPGRARPGVRRWRPARRPIGPRGHGRHPARVSRRRRLPPVGARPRRDLCRQCGGHAPRDAGGAARRRRARRLYEQRGDAWAARRRQPGRRKRAVVGRGGDRRLQAQQDRRRTAGRGHGRPRPRFPRSSSIPRRRSDPGT